jgi:flagellar hook-associated protein 3 FlgL
MRISTGYLFDQNLTAMLAQQAALGKTQLQISTGNKILNPSDDPVGAVEILNLQREINLSEQYLTNADKAENNLTLEEGVLEGSVNILQRIRELSVQGLNDTNGQSDRRAIAQEITQLNKQLLSLANTQDSSGNYLFSGYKSDAQPYTSIGASYAGDSGQRNLQVGAGVLIETNDPGNMVFEAERVQTSVDSSAATDSTLTIIQMGKNNTIPAGSTLDVNFNPGTNTLTVTMGALTQTVSPYVAGDEVKLTDLNTGFPDFTLKLDGNLTANDTYQLSTVSTKQTIFKTINEFAVALSNNSVGSNDSPNNGDFLTNISTALDTVVDTQAKLGARINIIEQQRGINDGLTLNLKKTLSQIKDLDYAEAISTLKLQELGLQASQQTFSRVQNLSLFNFL